MTELTVIPANMQLPARLRTPEMAAQIAAANASAAGGIKAGGFPSISIKANKFHIKDNGELLTLMMPAADGQPALPMMCLRVVVVGSNASLIKAFYEGEYVEGAGDRAPTCRSSNGITPDADVAMKQNDVCGTCKQNAWGSKISNFSQKEIKACDDNKQLAILPADDPAFKALGLQVHKGSLKNWGIFIRELETRGFSVEEIITNVTFDATQTGVLNFAMNRFLSDEESAKFTERRGGADVKMIVAQTRAIVVPLALAAPAVELPSAANTPGAAPATAGIAQVLPLAPQPSTTVTTTPAPPAPATTGFGAAPFTPPAAIPPAPATAPSAEPPKRTRRTRAEMAADAGTDPALAHLEPAILAAVLAVGKDSDAGKALLKQFPAPVTAAPDPFAGQPAHVKPAVEAAGGIGSAGGNAVWAALTNTAAPGTPGGVVVQGDPPAAPKAPPATAAAPPAPVTTGFGASVPAAPVSTAATTAPSAAITASAEALKARLQAAMAGNRPPAQ